MDLEKVEKYVAQINSLKRDIEILNKRKIILKKMNNVTVAMPTNHTSTWFDIEENNRFLDLNSAAIKAFKSLALDEINTKLAEVESELEILLKKGITDNENYK